MTEPETALRGSFWEQFPEGAPRDLVRAAIEAFAQRGFAATTTRDIGSAAGLSSAGLYVHFTSKADMLRVLSRAGHLDAAATLFDALDIDGSSVDRVINAVAALTKWHADNHLMARVVQYELRALTPTAYEEIAGLRRSMQRRVFEEIQAAVEAGEADVPDIAGVARALLSLCIDVCRWYDDKGPQTPDEIGALYAGLARRWLAVAPK